MNEISYKEEKNLDQRELLDLYGDADWGAYTCNPEQLVNAIKGSSYVGTARDNGKLVGLVRIVGDGQTIAYIQDILVKKSYKRNGIGTALLYKALEAHGHIRQKVLLTDDNKETRGFYESMGFESCDKGQLVSFVQLENKK